MPTKKQKKKSQSKLLMVAVDPLPRLHINTPEHGQIELWKSNEDCIYATTDCGEEIKLTNDAEDIRCLAEWLVDMADAIEKDKK